MLRGQKAFWSLFLQKNLPFYGIILFILCLGITVGSLAAFNMKAEQTVAIQELLESFLKQINTLTFSSVELIQLSVFNDILLIAIIYLLGLTVIGMPIMLTLIFSRGFILGFTVSFLLKEKAFHGIILASAAILPQNLLYLPALVASGATALSFTMVLFKRNFGANIRIWPAFLCYNGLMLTIMALAMGSSLIEAYITPFLTRFAVRLIT